MGLEAHVYTTMLATGARETSNTKKLIAMSTRLYVYVPVLISDHRELTSVLLASSVAE